MSRQRRSLLIAATIFGTLALIAPLWPDRASAGGPECCPDLEARIAELEATVLRKDRRDISLQVYGQVNRAILFWNDTYDSRAAIVDNSTSSSRIGFMGQGAIRAGLTAGYRAEFEVRLSPSEQTWNEADVAAAHGLPAANGLQLRHAYWYISDKDLGSVSLGHQSPATDNITIINLGSQMNDAAVHYNNAFNLRLNHPVLGVLFSDLKWGHVAHNVDTLRGEFIRYDTPLMLGFMFSASFGKKDVWDVALRYQTEWQGFRFAAGIGFMDEQEERYRDLKGSASLLHKSTGLYLSVASGVRDDDRSSIIGRPPAYFHYVQAGVSKRWFSYGDTTVYGDFGVYRNYNVGELLRVDPNIGQLVIWGTLSQAEVTRWGFGAEQAFDEAGVLLYAQAHRYEPDIVGIPCTDGPTMDPLTCGVVATNMVTLPMQGWSAFVVGARLRF